MNRLGWLLLFLLLGVAVFQLSAQTEQHPPTTDQIIKFSPFVTATNTSATNTPKTFIFEEEKFEETKAKAEKGD